MPCQELAILIFKMQGAVLALLGMTLLHSAKINALPTGKYHTARAHNGHICLLICVALFICTDCL